MARVGVTYEQLAAAAESIVASNGLPTCDALRNLIGSGSRTTIQRHRKRWLGGQAQPAIGCLVPAELAKAFLLAIEREVATETATLKHQLNEANEAAEVPEEECERLNTAHLELRMGYIQLASVLLERFLRELISSAQ